MSVWIKKGSIPPKEYVYTIPGAPVPWRRAGLNGRVFFDAQKQQKVNAGIVLSSQHDGELFTGPLYVRMIFYFGMPKSSKKHHAKMKQAYHYYKPDLSNLVKFVEDLAHGILFSNDCIIAHLDVCKLYEEEPRTELVIIPLSTSGIV